MIHLSQRDLRWASDRLGSSTLTVGRFGCTTTAISMLSDYFKCFKSPKELAADKRNYTDSGLIVWTQLRFPFMAFERRLYVRADTAIDQSLKDPKKGVLLQVNDGQHWVVATKKNLLGRYQCVDPWDGKTCDVLSRYKNITGSAHFRAA